MNSTSSSSVAGGASAVGSAARIIESLKAQLKLRGLSYRDLARVWNLSESSVKRVMSSDEVSLARIESACRLMELPLGDFFQQVNFTKEAGLFYLSAEQEARLARDPEALNYFLLLYEGRSPSELVREYSINAEKNMRLLNQLEKWGLIELHPQNRIKRKYLGNLRFRKNGPLGKHLESIVRTEFLQSDFEKEDEYFTFIHLNLIRGDLPKLKLKILELIKEMIAASDELRDHPNAQSHGLIMAVRPWDSPFTKVLPKRRRLR